MEWVADLDDDGLADSIFAVTVKLAIKLLFFSAKYFISLVCLVVMRLQSRSSYRFSTIFIGRRFALALHYPKATTQTRSTGQVPKVLCFSFFAKILVERAFK